MARTVQIERDNRSARAPTPALEALSDYGEAVTYQLVPTAPALHAGELDGDERALEVIVMWGELSVLRVDYLSPPRSYHVGDDSNANGDVGTDFLIGREALGDARMPITIASDAGIAVVVPAGASGETRNRFGVIGPKDNQDPHMSREQAMQVAAAAGIIGVLRANVGAWNSPTSPYGRDSALGTDPVRALGALMGDQIGLNLGLGGLGAHGRGRGAGGSGQGTIGVERGIDRTSRPPRPRGGQVRDCADRSRARRNAGGLHDRQRQARAMHRARRRPLDFSRARGWRHRD